MSKRKAALALATAFIFAATPIQASAIPAQGGNYSSAPGSSSDNGLYEAPGTSRSAPNATAPFGSDAQNPAGASPYDQNPAIPYGNNQPYSQNPGTSSPYGQAPGTGSPYGQAPGNLDPNSQTPGTSSPYGQAPYGQAPYGQNPNSSLPNGQDQGSSQYQTPGSSAPYSQTPGNGGALAPYGANGYNSVPGTSAPSTGIPGSGIGNGLPAIGGAKTNDASGATPDAGESTPDVKPDPVNGGRGHGEAGAYDPGRDRPLLKAEAVDGKIDVYYVNRGDSLWKISRKYMIDLDALIDANPELLDPDLIYPGDQIAVPLEQEEQEIAGANTDLGDGSVKIRSNIVSGRYSGTLQEKIANAEEEELFSQVNQARETAGLKALGLSKELSNIARLKADEMSLSSYFDHNSPVYGSPFEMLKSFGVTYRTAGENIAKGQKSAKAVLAAWMGSTGHKANIMSEKFTEMGIGFATDGKTTHWVQIFKG